MSYEIKKFEDGLTVQWNEFVSKSKNTSFLFNRSYMDYHKSRLSDYSLLFYKENKLCALIPGCKVDDSQYVSHAGLSYGGLVYLEKTRLSDVLLLFQQLILFLKENGFTQFLYKELPQIYNSFFSDEVIYGLFIHGGELYRRDVSCVINLKNKISWSKGRKALLSKSRSNGLIIKNTIDSTNILNECNKNLVVKYSKKAVHSAKELNLLICNFPTQIKCYEALVNDIFVSGVVLFINKNVLHAQYIANSADGKLIGGVEAIMEYILKEYPEHDYFDFGVSTEDDGKFLNQGLHEYKESFGGRTSVFNHYLIKL